MKNNKEKGFQKNRKIKGSCLSFFNMKKSAGKSKSFYKIPLGSFYSNKKVKSFLLRSHQIKKRITNGAKKKQGFAQGGKDIFQGEIGRKIKQSKSLLLIIPKKVPFGFFIESYKGSKYNQSSANSLFPGKMGSLGCKIWYIDKAAMLPGANMKLSTGFNKKNKVYKKIYSAYLLFKTYLALSKKERVNQYNNTNKGIQTNQRCFSLLVQIDSLFNLCQCKSGLVLNSSIKNRIKNYILNGKSIAKKSFYLSKKAKGIVKDGSFCIAQKPVLLLKKKQPLFLKAFFQR